MNSEPTPAISTRRFLITRADLAERLDLSTRNTYRFAPATNSHLVHLNPVRDALNASAKNGQPLIQGYCLPKLLSTRHAAERLGVSTRTLRAWAGRGAPHFCLVRNLLFDYDAIFCWAQSAKGLHRSPLTAI